MLETPAPHTLVTTPPLLQRLIDQFDALWVHESTDLSAIIPAHQQHDCVLLIAGDPVRFPESLDVAVVLPELQRYFSSRFQILVAERNSEDILAKRFAVTRRPALVFLRHGQYVTSIAGMLDWEDYLREVQHALDSPVSRIPGIGIPLVAADSGCR